MPYESPSGEVIEPGETFEASLEWYKAREHWHYLELAGEIAVEEVAPSHGSVLEAAGFTEIESSRRTVEEEFLLRDIPEPAEPIVETPLEEEPVVGRKRSRKRKPARQTESD